jgi:pimeloyl-ACP methyl ester carboxylesterase
VPTYRSILASLLLATPVAMTGSVALAQADQPQADAPQSGQADQPQAGQPQAEANQHPTDQGEIALGDFEYFFVGGEYTTNEEDENVVGGQMYVEHYTPPSVEHPYPVVMIHGGGQTGTNFLGTPDGRRGWLHDFLRAGYEIYIVDQPGRGRSGLFTELYGEVSRNPTSRIEQRFTAPEEHNLWPQAELHTQWPGTGMQGDPIFDQFYSSQVASFESGTTTEELNRDAGVALLDQIGPSVLLVHSQSGPFAWLLADARPDLVEGIVNIEPNGPPFYDVNFVGAPDWFEYDDTERTRDGESLAYRSATILGPPFLRI